MVCIWAHDPNGEEFKHHLARVPDYLWLAEDGMKMQSFGSQVWDSTLATQAVLSTGMVEEYGDCLKKAHFYIKESQMKENPKGDFKAMYSHFTKGAWTFSDQDQGWVVSDCTAEALKLSSQGAGHDEIDFEFLGKASGEPYTMHTNVYAQGKEQQFRLWFDPTIEFHTYSIVWNAQRIIFLVDNIQFRYLSKFGIKLPRHPQIHQ